jgi:ligand-binding sensor domain-containing protein
MKNNILIICFIIFSQKIFSQEITNLNHLSNNIPEKPLFQKNIFNGKQINISTEVESGSWKVFKNWNTGTAVVAENDSVVWVGTPVGLVRWNTTTHTYKTYDEINGLRFTAINSLALDKNNRLWIAAMQGVAVFDGTSFTHYDFNNTPLPNSRMDVIRVDNLNRIIVAIGWPLDGGYLADGGVARFDGNQWTLWPWQSSIYAGPTYDMELYKDTMWICGGESLMILTDNGLEVAPGWGNLGGAQSIAVDYQDSLWVEAMVRKTLKYTNEGWRTIIDRDAEYMGSLFDNIWNDPRGGLWLSIKENWWTSNPLRLDIEKRRLGEFCGTNYMGICTIPNIPGQFFAHCAVNENCQYFVSLGYGSNYPQLNINQGGLFKFNGSTWEIFRIPTTILDNSILTIGKGLNGEIYLTNQFYAQKTNGNNWIKISKVNINNQKLRLAPDDSLFTNSNNQYGFLYSFEYDGYGDLWTVPAVIQRGLTGNYSINHNNAIKNAIAPYNPDLREIISDRDENIWTVGENYGAVKYDRHNWIGFRHSDTTLPNLAYNKLFADSKGNTWFGYNNGSPNYGFTKYDGKEWKTYYSPQRYFISYVNDMDEDQYGNIWIATNGGLLKYEGDEFTVFDRFNSPLSLNYTSAVKVDDRGNLWIGTKNGLYIYNPNAEIELGGYSFPSPTNNLNVKYEEKRVKASFQPINQQQGKIVYELERGRGQHKYWKVSEKIFDEQVPQSIELIDSSIVIGKYYYRINEVTSDGKQRYSDAIEVLGGTPGVTLLNFSKYTAGDKLYLKWQTNDEEFVSRYEVWKSDTTNMNYKIFKAVLASTSDDSIKQYEIEADKLDETAESIYYNLRVVFVDSSYNTLDTLEIRKEQNITSPVQFEISKNYPNPFNSRTNFDFSNPTNGLITMRIYNTLGEEVYFYEKFMEEGYFSLQLNFDHFPSGVYFYSVRNINKVLTGKMILLK